VRISGEMKLRQKWMAADAANRVDAANRMKPNWN
jgi:hypothetical protein